jgi:hypothetical protein
VHLQRSNFVKVCGASLLLVPLLIFFFFFLKKSQKILVLRKQQIKAVSTDATVAKESFERFYYLVKQQTFISIFL